MKRLSASRSPSLAVAVVAVAALVAPTGAETSVAQPRAAASVVGAAAPLTAVSAVKSLPVKGRAPKTGYARAAFGQAWADTDRNGCDTRNDVLRRDMRPYVLKAGTNGCLVLSGTLRDPYTTKIITFVRGPASARVQVDHVVALSDAWQKGAQGWTATKRRAFANDGLNLLAVDGPTNQRKSDGDAATWLPPAKGYRCRYVARQATVKRKYGLWVTPAERAAMLGVLTTCLNSGSSSRPRSASAAAPPPAPHPSQHPSRRPHPSPACSTRTATPSAPPAQHPSDPATPAGTPSSTATATASAASSRHAGPRFVS